MGPLLAAAVCARRHVSVTPWPHTWVAPCSDGSRAQMGRAIVRSMASDPLLLVGGILGCQLLIWIPLILFLRKRVSSKRDALLVQIQEQGEAIVLGPVPALYRGSDAPSLPRAKGNAVVALTDKRLLIERLFGVPIAIPRERIVGARQAHWFLGAATSMKQHLILQLRGGGEVGLLLGKNHPAWFEHFTARRE